MATANKLADMPQQQVNFQLSSSMPRMSQSEDDDEESFVVLGKSLIDTSIIQESQDLIAEELEQMKISAAAINSQNAESNHELFASTTSSLDMNAKLDDIKQENIRLKNVIEQNNISMAEQVKKMMNWKEDVQEIHDSYKKRLLEAAENNNILKFENQTIKATLQKKENDNAETQTMEKALEGERKMLGEFKEANAKLILENLTLRGEVDGLQEKIKMLNDAERQMSEMKKNVDHYSEENTKLKENVRILTESDIELRKQVDQCEAELAKLLVQNQQMSATVFTSREEIKQIHLQENTKDEQLRNAQLAITELEARNNDILKELQFKDEMIAKFKEESEMAISQLSAYKDDFDAEKAAKESIMSEKKRLAEDLQQLLHRNHQLQEEIELLRERGDFVYYPHTQAPEPIRPGTAPTQDASSNSTPPPARYFCPICNKSFRSLQLVEGHVDLCINNQAA